MRKIAFLLALLLPMSFFVGCGDKSEETAGEISSETVIANKPEIEQIRSICTLATLECYYHNVAKAVKPAEKGILHIGEKDRTFWIEYTGIAKVGVDLSEVSMQVDENVVRITIPDAKLISINVDKTTFNQDSFVFSEDSWNENKITSDDQTKAVKDAQETMKKAVETDKTLLMTAQTRAMKLIEKYIEQIGEMSNVKFKIEWVTTKGVEIPTEQKSEEQ